MSFRFHMFKQLLCLKMTYLLSGDIFNSQSVKKIHILPFAKKMKTQMTSLTPSHDMYYLHLVSLLYKIKHFCKYGTTVPSDKSCLEGIIYETRFTEYRRQPYTISGPHKDRHK